MKPISSELNTRLIKKVQTPSTNAEPSVDLWISRIDTPLKYDELLEKKTITSSGGVTDCDVAVRHCRFGLTAQEIYMAYVTGGTAKVAVSPYYEVMRRHEFIDSGFSETASRVAIAFDGTMPKTVKGVYEFLTEDKPWVFWINDGALYGKKLGDAASVTLAETNATAVSAVRAMWSEVSGFDFGLCVFFILSGAVYYRQLIDGIWCDAAPVPVASLPTLADGVAWVQIDASRTWDYRIALQLVDSAGKMYEVYTQYGGIGSKNAEHIEIRDITADGELTKVYYKDTQNEEHIEINNINAGALYGGLYSLDIPSIVSAVNIDDGTGDYGKKAVFTFDVHLNATEVSAQYAQFAIVDTNSVSYVAASAALGVDGKTVTLTFTDFNNARGECKATYTAGTVTSMAGTALTTSSCSFTPTGLVPTAVPVPEVTEVTNV